MEPQPYPSDLSDEEWSLLAPLLVPGRRAGRPRVFEPRRIADAALYLLRTGRQWRALPHDFPPWPTVYYHYSRWRRSGAWLHAGAAVRATHRVPCQRRKRHRRGVLERDWDLLQCGAARSAANFSLLGTGRLLMRADDPCGSAWLLKALQALPRQEPDAAPIIGFGEAPVRLTVLVEPGSGTLDTWLATEAAIHPGIDRKAQATFLLGKLVRSVTLPFACLLLRHAVVFRTEPDQIGFTPSRYHWEHLGESGEQIRYIPHLGGGALRQGDAEVLRACLHDEIVTTMRALVRALCKTSGLSTGALWRIVANMVRSAFLFAGEQLGNLAEARTEGLAVTRQSGSPLNNGTSGFQRVTLPDPADPARTFAERWFLKRGGCCRWYTCAEGEYCSACVLLKPEQQQAKLRDYLRRQHAIAAA